MDDELRGWKAIADYFGTSDRTAQRWERDLALPVRRRGNAKGSAVVASRVELDEWRSSPAGRQAEGEQVHDPVPPPARVRRPLAWVLAAIALLLVIAASWYWARPVGRPEAPVADQRPAAQAAIPNAQHSGAAAVAVLKLTAASGEVWSIRVIDGAMATWESTAGRTLGLSVSITGGQARVTVSEIRNADVGAGRPIPLGVLTVAQGVPTPTAYAGAQLMLEWTGIEGRSANAPARSTVVPPRCCVVCGGVTVCATEVTGWCGSCCDPRFTSCRPPI